MAIDNHDCVFVAINLAKNTADKLTNIGKSYGFNFVDEFLDHVAKGDYKIAPSKATQREMKLKALLEDLLFQLFNSDNNRGFTLNELINFAVHSSIASRYKLRRDRLIILMFSVVQRMLKNNIIYFSYGVYFKCPDIDNIALEDLPPEPKEHLLPFIEI